MRELRRLARPAHARRRSARCCPGRCTLVIANPERRYPLACREDPERLGVQADRRPAARARDASSSRPAPTAPASPRRRGFEDVDPAIVEAVDLAIDGGELTGQPVDGASI